MNRFDVKIGGSQAGLLTFSDFAVMRAPIGRISQGEQFNKLVGNISQTGTDYTHSSLPLHCLHVFLHNNKLYGNTKPKAQICSNIGITSALSP